MAALSKHAREFKVVVHEVNANVKPPTGSTDSVVIEFVGKLNPSTKKRIGKALVNGEFELRERVLA